MVEPAWAVVGGNVTVKRLPATGIAMLRLRGFDAGVLGSLSDILGVPLPTRPNTSSGATPRALCLAPGEWMITDRPGEPGPVMADATAAKVSHIAQIGEGVVTYAVSGPAARDLLAKGCTLDLHPRKFAAGQCAQTLLAQVDVVMDRPDDGDSFVVHAAASYAHHLEQWFADAAIEFLPEVTP